MEIEGLITDDLHFYAEGDGCYRLNLPDRAGSDLAESCIITPSGCSTNMQASHIASRILCRRLLVRAEQESRDTSSSFTITTS